MLFSKVMKIEKASNKLKKKGKKKKSSEEDVVLLDMEECYNTSKVQVLQVNSDNSVVSSDIAVNSDSVGGNGNVGSSVRSSSDSDSSSSSESILDYGKFCERSISPYGEITVGKRTVPEKIFSRNVRIIDTDYVVLPSDEIIIIRSKLNVKILLPELPVEEITIGDSYNGRYLKIKNKNYNIEVYLVAAPSNTINDSELKSYTLGGRKKTELVYAGNTWITL